MGILTVVDAAEEKDGPKEERRKPVEKCRSLPNRETCLTERLWYDLHRFPHDGIAE